MSVTIEQTTPQNSSQWQQSSKYTIIFILLDENVTKRSGWRLIPAEIRKGIDVAKERSRWPIEFIALGWTWVGWGWKMWRRGGGAAAALGFILEVLRWGLKWKRGIFGLWTEVVGEL